MKIIELSLPSTHLDSQERLFRDVLGFPCSRPQEERLLVSCGATTLNFLQAERQYYFHYCFLVPPGCLNSVIAFLDEREFQPLFYHGSRIIDFGNGQSVYFYDADGNLAEFIERPMLGHAVQSGFDISDVIRLNEIGMPTDNPLQKAGELIGRFGIELAEDAVKRDDFVWCGDYEGVFLLPAVGRNWIPADKPAEVNALDVRFETSAGQFEYTVSVEPPK